MLPQTTLSDIDLQELDRIYREGGLRQMASPHVHYHDAACPHAGCGHTMEWIDFRLELFGDVEGVYKPLVRAWWEGTGFAGRCPACGGWIRFDTLRMHAIDAQQAARLLRLPENWHTVAQFA